MADQPPSNPSTPPFGGHRAPPMDMRPRAPIALWALGLGIALSLASILLGGLWIATVPALLLAVVALLKIRPMERRGQGMAMAALILCLMAGSCSYMGAKALHDAAERIGGEVLASLSSEEPDRLKSWIAPKAFEDGSADTIRQRFQAVVGEYGPYQRAVDSGSLLLGAGPVVVPPTDATEIGPPGTESVGLRSAALWVKARFEKGTVYVELLAEGEDASARMQALEKALQQGSAPVLVDVRFFRPAKP